MGIDRATSRPITADAAAVASAFAVTAVGQLALLAVTARVLSPEDFVSYLVYASVIPVSAAIGAAGLNRKILREVSTIDAESPLPPRLRTELRLTMTYVAPACAIAAGSLLLGVDALRSQPVNVTHGALAAMWSYGVTVQTISAALHRARDGRLRANLSEGRSGGPLTISLQIACTLIATTASGDWRLTAILAASMVGAVAAASAINVRPLLGTFRSHSAPAISLTAFVKGAAPYATAGIAVLISGAMDVWLAALLLTATEGAHYAAAFRLAVLVGTPVAVVQVATARRLARSLASGVSDAQVVASRTALLGLIPAGLLAATLLTSPSFWLSRLYGEDFSSAAPLLIPFVIFGLVDAFTGPCGPALTYSGYENIVSTINWLAVGVRASLVVLLIGNLQAVSLAVASSSIAVTGMLALWLSARRTTRVWTHASISRARRGR